MARWKPSLKERIRYILWGYDNTIRARHQERVLRFSRLTGLHGTFWHAGKTPSDDEVIAMQAHKIRGLELQLNQQARGTGRKIAKFKREIASLQPKDAGHE